MGVGISGQLGQPLSFGLRAGLEDFFNHLPVSGLERVAPAFDFFKSPDFIEIPRLEVLDGLADGPAVDRAQEFADVFELPAPGTVRSGFTGQIDGLAQLIRQFNIGNLVRRQRHQGFTQLLKGFVLFFQLRSAFGIIIHFKTAEPVAPEPFGSTGF